MVQQFLQNTVSLRIQGTVATDPTCDNCRRRLNYVTTIDIDETPLPKRRLICY